MRYYVNKHSLMSNCVVTGMVILFRTKGTLEVVWCKCTPHFQVLYKGYLLDFTAKNRYLPTRSLLLFDGSLRVRRCSYRTK